MSIVLTKITETQNTITLGWTPVPGAIGYRFTAENQAKPSHTWNPGTSQVKFSKGSAWYKVEALGVEDEGKYPASIPPDPPPPGEPPAIAGQGYHIAFEDQFVTLDVGHQNTWSMGIWYSQPLPDSRHLYLQNGRAQLRSIKGVAPHYPCLTTLHHTGVGGRAWKFGYFEASMRWDAVSGAWPAFWLLSKLDRYGQNAPDTPQQWCSELDIFEGYMDSYFGPTGFTGTLHKNTGGRWGIPDETRGVSRAEVANMTTGFHKYAALWTASEVAWFFDDVELARVPAFASTAQDMFLILTMQYANHVPMGADTMNLEVDWVKVWQK